jgi:DNA-binding NtrC family response regulator
MEAPEQNRGAREKVLLVDDTPANLSVLAALLEQEGYEVLAAPNGASALKVAAKAQPGAILMDVLMPDLDGLETCRRLKENPETRDIPVIFITARGESEHVIAGFKAGGVDYVVKPFQSEEVATRVATHLRIGRLTHQLQEKNRALELRSAELLAEIERRHQAESALRQADDKLAAFSNVESLRGSLSGLVGRGTSIRKLVEEIGRLQQFPQTSILITGESGTGKELVARAIHFGSARAKAPFVPVNCAAIPAELAESLLFGHAKGAFTGALTDRKGCFELANGGTLFLDEVGDMPALLQSKLLRVLEDGWLAPVGGSTSIQVDVRVIAATNADLDERIAAGTFRQDLYFRLARYLVTTPPLRERAEDIPLLAAHFLRSSAAEMGLKDPGLSSAAVEVLASYSFPGNVRELKNVIERALIDCDGKVIETEHLQLRTRRSAPAINPSAFLDLSPSDLPLNLSRTEDLLIQRALKQTGGNIADAARLLGIHRTRIYRKLARGEPSSSD